MIKMFKILPSSLKRQFYIGTFLIIVNVLITMFIPILISQFLPLLINSTGQYQIIIFNITAYTSNNFSNTLGLLLGITLGMIAFSALMSISGLLIIVWAGEKASNYYRDALFCKYQILSLKEIAHITPESLITRINDDVAVFWDFLIGASTTLIKAPFYIITGLIFAFLTDVPLTWAIIAVIPLLLFVMTFIFKYVRPHIMKNRKNLDAITKESDENILGIRFIQAYNLQDQQYAKFKAANRKWRSTESSIFSIFSLAMPAFFFIINLIVVFIYSAAYVILDKDHSLANTTQLIAKINAFMEYEFIIAFGISSFSQFLGTLFRARVSAQRITYILDFQSSDRPFETNLLLSNQNKAAYSIEFKNLNFKYFETSEDYVLKDINFKLESGQTLGIIGPTGSGKSTLANLLVKNMQYLDGNILIDGKEVNHIDTNDLRKDVGIVYQDALLYSGSIKSNLLFAKENATDLELQQALNASCADEFVENFSDKWDHEVGQRGKNLSGGQKQRLTIARTLLIKPKILILDDSTSALDNITTKKLISNLNRDYQTTNIIITQKINSIKHADKILVLDKGRIIASGTHNELIQNCQWYWDVNYNQLEQ
ncbi:ATP-binding cassette subfamily B protein [Mycoplasmopsis mustelae]|uniref:ATP-binding cassette subfamily B protein n=1 Tax=Mycoplasmopsis mustelae TaxID=171289 RepID=A0A4R7UCD0_9BACT|nr:ABC transporter ATP-binding protein [Mycoplasmopsis mustelae]TDV24082.1 ATP-binding cassette subfamily B protein [Mycoplasmopsis mustelae]